MITDDLKSQIQQLSSKEKSELSSYLTKLKLEEDPELWKEIRERTHSYGPASTMDIEDL
ncbi:hypothetical protein [Rubritalea marina]|uniref:hypothetical protein n=1 Tax=Rubritalea marina TaxID=361055 RepID=UPI00036068B3|nr:hypothetical protein [Rubritalea marina]